MRRPSSGRLILACPRSNSTRARGPNRSVAAAEVGTARNRLSQIVTRTFLAPDIQLEMFALEAVDGVEPPITERWLFEKVARLLG